MAKRFAVAVGALIGIIIIVFVSYAFYMGHESVPDKRSVEKMVEAADLQKFGDVEGSFLYTPHNYGFYNDSEIYIVEKALEEGEAYKPKYVVIDAGLETAAEDKNGIIKLQNGLSAKGNASDFEIISKHQVAVYEQGELVHEEWFFKVIIEYEDETHLSFMSDDQDGSGQGRFNLFSEGFVQFADF